MSDQVELELVACPEASRVARRFVATKLRRWRREQDVDTVLLVVSELVTNAVRHGTAPLRLDLEHHDGAIVVSVFDSGALDEELVRCQVPTPDEPNGRGLVIVDALSESWGVVEVGGGKTVWSRVATAEH